MRVQDDPNVSQMQTKMFCFNTVIVFFFPSMNLANILVFPEQNYSLNKLDAKINKISIPNNNVLLCRGGGGGVSVLEFRKCLRMQKGHTLRLPPSPQFLQL